MLEVFEIMGQTLILTLDSLWVCANLGLCGLNLWQTGSRLDINENLAQLSTGMDC